VPLRVALLCCASERRHHRAFFAIGSWRGFLVISSIVFGVQIKVIFARFRNANRPCVSWVPRGFSRTLVGGEWVPKTRREHLALDSRASQGRLRHAGQAHETGLGEAQYVPLCSRRAHAHCVLKDESLSAGTPAYGTAELTVANVGAPLFRRSKREWYDVVFDVPLYTNTLFQNQISFAPCEAGAPHRRAHGVCHATRERSRRVPC
jgi:hypothetical protein